MTGTKSSYIVELPRKSGGTHLRTIKRQIRRNLFMNTDLKDDEAFARRVVIGIIRKGDRYVPPKRWYDMIELEKRIRECGENNRRKMIDADRLIELFPNLTDWELEVKE